jgi:hypothetical protein
MSDPTDPKKPGPETDEDTSTGRKDVIVFYDAEGKVARVLPAADVRFIVPDRLLRPDATLEPYDPSTPGQPSKLPRPPRTMAWPGGEPEDKDEE